VLIIAYTPQEFGSVNLQPPDGFAVGFVVGLGQQELAMWHRQDVPAGETSWLISSPSTLADLIMWFAYEVGGPDVVTPLERNFQPTGGTGVTTQSTGTTTNTNYTDLMCIAVHCCNSIKTIDQQTNGFVAMETQQQTSGAGHGAGTVAVSRLYPNAGGTFECTATYSAASNTVAGITVYRGAAELPVSPGGIAVVV